MPLVSARVPVRAPRSVKLPTPPAVLLPLNDFAGGLCRCMVQKGQPVLLGEMIGQAGPGGASVHASVSGTVRAVSAGAVVIESDPRQKLHPACTPLLCPSDDQLRQRTSVMGLLTADGRPLLPDKGCRILVLSLLARDGREPEALSLFAPDQVFCGLHLAQQLWSPGRTVVFYDRRRPASGALARALCRHGEVLPADGRYPGGEPQILRRRLCGLAGKDPGITLLDAQSAVSLYEAVYLGQPLIHRQTVLAGAGPGAPVSVDAPLGAAMGHLLSAAGIVRSDSRPLRKDSRLVIPIDPG